jgi:hypothetical protein
MGLPVYNQLQILAFRNEQLVSNTGGRIRQIKKLISNNNNVPLLSNKEALVKALQDRKISFSTTPVLQRIEKEGRLYIFDNMGVSREAITAQLMWVPLNDNKKVELAWEIYIIPNNSSDYWLVRISAINGETIGVSNLTVYCNWDKTSDHASVNHSSNIQNL